MPLTAELIANTNNAALRALADVERRRKWGDSKQGSPVMTNALCAEISRLNQAGLNMERALEQILDAVDDTRLVDRLKEIERIATAALLAARGGPVVDGI